MTETGLAPHLPHSADEAGGEALFTSDGLPALIAPLPPPPLSSDGRGRSGSRHHDNIPGDDDDDIALIVQEELDPRIAFQAFNRHPPTNAGSWNLDRSAAADSTDTDDIRRLGGEGEEEGDPPYYWQRLHRLKAEIEKLETELNKNTTESNKNNDNSDINNDSNLKTMMLELKSRVDALGMPSSLLAKRQEHLSRIIFDQSADQKMKDLQVLHHRQEHQQEQQENVPTTPSSTTLSMLPTQREALLEERLRRLENVLGYTTTTTGNNNYTNASILERIEEAERLTRETTDVTQLEKLAAKAKVIRADLEAAARAKTKLGSSSAKPSSSSSFGSTTTITTANTVEEDSRVISALHAQLIELEGMSTHLPALTLRLLELSNLHTHAAEFASRLFDAELAVGRSERMLMNVEEALTKMEHGWKENTNVLERNVKRLDEMVESLSLGEKK